MALLSKLTCDKCGHDNDRNRGKCDRCNENIGSGYPNVNVYADSYFEEAVQRKYKNCMIDLPSKAGVLKVRDFTEAVKEKAQPVINMNNNLFFLLVNDREDYLPYRRAVEDGKRIASLIHNDHRRTVIDTSFYGIHGADIVFAALSLDEKGLTSYGNISVTLNSVFTENRTTVFARNSFELYDELTKDGNWNPADFPPPAGSFTVWNNRDRIAVVKHHEEIINDTQNNNFADILLKCDGNRSNDEFIELHIFGKISYLTFLKVKQHDKSYASIEEKIDWEIATATLKKADISITTA